MSVFIRDFRQIDCTPCPPHNRKQMKIEEKGLRPVEAACACLMVSLSSLSRSPVFDQSKLAILRKKGKNF